MQSTNENGLVDSPKSKQPEVLPLQNSTELFDEVHRLSPKHSPEPATEKNIDGNVDDESQPPKQRRLSITDRRAYDAVEKRGKYGMTRFEIAESLNKPASDIGAVVIRLIRVGLLYESDQFRPSPRGNPSGVLVATANKDGA